MYLEQIDYGDEIVTGIDVKTQQFTAIHRSISYIYTRVERTITGNPEVIYRALSWKDKIEFGLIEAALLGYEIDSNEQLDLDKIVIRFGWISKSMLELKWTPLTELIDKYLEGKLNFTERNKFRNICRTLNIPMRTMSKRRKAYQSTKTNT